MGRGERRELVAWLKAEAQTGQYDSYSIELAEAAAEQHGLWEADEYDDQPIAPSWLWTLAEIVLDGQRGEQA